jgi:hypothetical protein
MTELLFARLVHTGAHESAALFKALGCDADVATPTYSTSAICDFLHHPTEARLHILATGAEDLHECALSVAYESSGLVATLLVGDQTEAATMEQSLLRDGHPRDEPRCVSVGSAVVAIAIWTDPERTNWDVGSVLVVSPSLSVDQPALLAAEATRAVPRKCVLFNQQSMRLIVGQ